MENVEKHDLYGSSAKKISSSHVDEAGICPHLPGLIHRPPHPLLSDPDEMWIILPLSASFRSKKEGYSAICIFIRHIQHYTGRFIHTFHGVWMTFHSFCPQHCKRPKSGGSGWILDCVRKMKRTKHRVIPKLCNTCG